MRQFRFLTYLLGLLFLFASVSYGQLSNGGTPHSFQQFSTKSQINARVMAPVDVAAMLAEDDIEEQEGLPFRFGFHSPVAVDRGRLWRHCGLDSRGAKDSGTGGGAVRWSGGRLAAGACHPCG